MKRKGETRKNKRGKEKKNDEREERLHPLLIREFLLKPLCAQLHATKQ